MLLKIVLFSVVWFCWSEPVDYVHFVHLLV